METVARASTGVYGMPVDAILAARGGRVPRVHARHLTHVPGCKRKVQDGQWIPHLQTRGLLSGSCRPAAEKCAVRAYVRQRAAVLEDRAAPMQPRQQERPQMTNQ